MEIVLEEHASARPQISDADVVSQASQAVFGKPLVVNVWRAVLVETLISLALPSDWTWCSADYAGWDFQHADGTRLEVKQSAARQSWQASTARPGNPRFDIARRAGAWNGSTWLRSSERVRYADLYVLAYHPVADATADHRKPDQWTFHVIDAAMLPATKSLSIASARQLAAPIRYLELPDVVQHARMQLRKNHIVRPVS